MSHAAQSVAVAVIVGGTAVMMLWRVFGLFGRKHDGGCDKCPAKKD
jgi:hypothetical protein